MIGNAACEPHVQDLCRFLVGLGARIDGIGSNVLRIEGVQELHGGEHRICPDHIEIVSFMGLAAITEGEIWIDGVEPADLHPMEHHLRRLGIDYSVEGTSVLVGSAVAVLVFLLCFVIAILYQRFVLRRDVHGTLTRMGAV